MIISIDMLNLDNTYIAINSNEVFDSNKRCRSNIRPLINDKIIDISDHFEKELITQHRNHSNYSYESWLAMYIKKYIEEVNQPIDKIVFTIPHLFNTQSINIAMNILRNKFNINIPYELIYDYLAAVTYINNIDSQSKVAIVPSEYETTIVYIENQAITKLHTIPYGSYHIKNTIKNAVPFDISLNDAWTIYKNLQMIPTVDLSKILLSIENSFTFDRLDLTSNLSYYYNRIINEIPSNATVVPLRWFARDYTIKYYFDNIFTKLNPDEAICLGAHMYVENNVTINCCKDNYLYVDNNNYSCNDYNDLTNMIENSKLWNEFVNIVDMFLIDSKLYFNVHFNADSIRQICFMINNSDWKLKNPDKYNQLINIAEKII